MVGGKSGRLNSSRERARDPYDSPDKTESNERDGSGSSERQKAGEDNTITDQQLRRSIVVE